jgi:hypothetical protein
MLWPVCVCVSGSLLCHLFFRYCFKKFFSVDFTSAFFILKNGTWLICCGAYWSRNGPQGGLRGKVKACLGLGRCAVPDSCPWASSHCEFCNTTSQLASPALPSPHLQMQIR